MAKVVKFKARLVIEAEVEVPYEYYNSVNPTVQEISTIEMENMEIQGSEYFDSMDNDVRKYAVTDVRIVEGDADETVQVSC